MNHFDARQQLHREYAAMAYEILNRSLNAKQKREFIQISQSEPYQKKTTTFHRSTRGNRGRRKE